MKKSEEQDNNKFINKKLSSNTLLKSNNSKINSNTKKKKNNKLRKQEQLKIKQLDLENITNKLKIIFYSQNKNQ